MKNDLSERPKSSHSPQELWARQSGSLGANYADRVSAPVRMKDIARDLHLSLGTVSKALRSCTSVTAETRARVLQRARELRYKPNLTARALRTGRTGLIGLVVPDLLNSFFAETAAWLLRELQYEDFGLVISSSEEDPELEWQAVDRLLAKGVDALLVASTQQAPEMFRVVEARGVPYILLDRYFAGLKANFVGASDGRVGSIATGHLTQIGCRAIAYIGGTQATSAQGRLEGYKQTLAQNSMPLKSDHIVCTDHSDTSPDRAGYWAAMRLLDVKPRPDGVFCCSDPIAVGVMAAILDAGLRIPEDIAIIGAGNLSFDQFLRVPLSTVDQRSTMLAHRAAEMAISLIEADAPVRPKAILLEPRLVVRESTTRRIVRQPLNSFTISTESLLTT